jgi:uncharacterized membrane protein YhiD involved in acid resistance
MANISIHRVEDVVMKKTQRDGYSTLTVEVTCDDGNREEVTFFMNENSSLTIEGKVRVDDL